MDDAGHSCCRVIIRYGLMEEFDIPRGSAALACLDGSCDPMITSYFPGRQKLMPPRSITRGMVC